MDFFKRNTDGTDRRRAGADLDSNPYLNAKRTWNEHEGSILAAKRMWQALTLLSLLIALGAVGGIIHIGEQSKFIPFIVQVDTLGQTVAVSPAERAAPVDVRIVHATLAAFINDARMVTPDVTVQRNAIFRVYSMLNPNDPAMIKMNDWLNGDAEASPFKRAAKEIVNCEIVSVIAQSPETWQVDWKEITRDRQGSLKATSNMRALITVYFVTPDKNTTVEQIRRNPIGIFIREFSWSRQTL
jgi:type IV secretion system protein VirB5